MDYGNMNIILYEQLGMGKLFLQWVLALLVIHKATRGARQIILSERDAQKKSQLVLA